MIPSHPLTRSLLRLALAALLAASVVATASAQTPERKVVEPAAGSPDEVVQRAMSAALDPNEEAGFEAYLALMHPDHKATRTAEQHIRKFSWKRFRKQVRDYLVADDKAPAGRPVFVVVRQDPESLGADDKKVRLFVRASANKRRELPTPIRLQREGDAGAWRITENSL